MTSILLELAQQEFRFVDVSDVPEKAVMVISELKSMEEHIEKEKERTKDMHEAVDPYAHSISLLLENLNYQNISKQNVRELQKMQSELAVYLKQLGSIRRLKKQVSQCLCKKQS